MCMSILSVYVHVSAPSSCSAHRGQRRKSELALDDCNLPMGAGN